MKRPAFLSRRQSGFSFIELLVTLVIVSIGILGLAKLQAAAVTESQGSRTRAIMTFQAESLASLMRSNSAGYWGAANGGASVAPLPNLLIATKAADFTVTDSAGTLLPRGGSAGSHDPATYTCVNLVTPAKCSPANIAYDDIYSWATAFAKQFPDGASAKIDCTLSAGPPTNCDITLTWNEHYAAINRSTASSAAQPPAAPPVNLVVHVQP